MLGRESVSTFYYSISKGLHLPEAEFPRSPLLVVRYFERILGKVGFRALEIAILYQIKETFQITEPIRIEAMTIESIIPLAKSNYIGSQLVNCRS
jgi:hypothetical protein